MMPLILTGERILLRDMTEDDVPQYYEWYWESNPQSMTCRPVRRRQIDELIAHMKEHFEKRDVHFLSIRLRSDDSYLGRITLFDLNESNRSIEVGYMLGPPYRQQGYAREAMDLVLQYVFETLQLNRIVAQTGAFNQASISLLKSLGFKHEGTLRQHHLFNDVLYDDLLYGLLAPEWRNK